MTLWTHWQAIAETVYSEVYIDVCRILFPWGVATVVARQNCPAIVFRCVLLTKCQEEFEKDKQEDEERKTMQKGVETAETVSHVTITWGIGVTLSLSGGDKETATYGTGSS